jgi:hypothetical protein
MLKQHAANRQGCVDRGCQYLCDVPPNSASCWCNAPTHRINFAREVSSSQPSIGICYSENCLQLCSVWQNAAPKCMECGRVARECAAHDGWYFSGLLRPHLRSQHSHHGTCVLTSLLMTSQTSNTTAETTQICSQIFCLEARVGNIKGRLQYPHSDSPHHHRRGPPHFFLQEQHSTGLPRPTGENKEAPLHPKGGKSILVGRRNKPSCKL